MPPAPGELASRAPAKVNLALHLLGRRQDGYHALSSLVAFAGVADRLSLTPGRGLSLAVTGPTAAAAGDGPDNLVLRAARRLAEAKPGIGGGAFRLFKRLPVAAGIGGGSSDAAAALRLLAQAGGLSPNDPELVDAARAVGSDVPVCLDPRLRMMEGAGETVGPALDGPTLFAVLVNPGIAVPTPAVFAALGLAPGQHHLVEGRPVASVSVPRGLAAPELLALLSELRNDLEAPARAVAPVIGDVLDTLARLAGCALARMSGSGATCFGLFADRRAAVAAARALRREQPAWWIAPTALR